MNSRCFIGRIANSGPSGSSDAKPKLCPKKAGQKYAVLGAFTRPERAREAERGNVG